MKMRKEIATLVALVFICLAASLAATVFAANPSAPEQITSVNTSTRTINNADKTLSAFAGNVSELRITHTQITNRWQGYYGNVTGTITLDNANNYTLYDWSLGTVEGEIYAANASGIGWSTVRCINLSANTPGNNCTGQDEACLNVTEIEGAYGMSAADNDGVDETFDGTLGSINVGSVALSNCPMVNLYVNDTSVANYYWNETLLTYNNSETIIYAGIVNDNAWGFNNVTWDFQMIVGDNGENAAATNYYFYVELT